MGTRTRSIASVLAVLALAGAGCGDDDSDEGGGNGGGGASTQPSDSGGAEAGGGGGGGATTIKLAAPADGALKFDKTSLSAQPGKVTIDFDNPSEVPHAVEVEGNGVEEETETITGAKAKVTVDLKPGEYEFYCPVGNHEQAGMKGTLTVG